MLPRFNQPDELKFTILLVTLSEFRPAGNCTSTAGRRGLVRNCREAVRIQSLNKSRQTGLIRGLRQPVVALQSCLKTAGFGQRGLQITG
jgi:hypothetical protein